MAGGGVRYICKTRGKGEKYGCFATRGMQLRELHATCCLPVCESRTSHTLHALVAALHFTLTDFTCTGVMGSSCELLQMMVWPFWPFTKKKKLRSMLLLRGSVLMMYTERSRG